MDWLIYWLNWFNSICLVMSKCPKSTRDRCSPHLMLIRNVENIAENVDSKDLSTDRMYNIPTEYSNRGYNIWFWMYLLSVVLCPFIQLFYVWGNKLNPDVENNHNMVVCGFYLAQLLYHWATWWYVVDTRPKYIPLSHRVVCGSDMA